MKKVEDVDFNQEVKFIVLAKKIYADKKYRSEAIVVAKNSLIANKKEMVYNTAINN